VSETYGSPCLVRCPLRRGPDAAGRARVCVWGGGGVRVLWCVGPGATAAGCRC
jgi:hypothetical protein